MFKMLKNKILSCLLVIGALTQTAKAQESFSHDGAHAVTADVSSSSNVAWPIGVGILTLGALVAMKKSCDYTDSESVGSYYFGDDQTPFTGYASITNPPVKTTNILPSMSDATSKNIPLPDQNDQRVFDPLAIRPIAHGSNMSEAERNLLAERLRAARKMEDINRERSRLTRQMTKAKRTNDVAALQSITLRRKELSALRKEAYALVAGPLWTSIKEERRQLAKKMAQARRRQDMSVKNEINKRRRMLNTQEELLRLTVADFKYKSDRCHFLKKKKTLPLAHVVADRYRMVA